MATNKVAIYGGAYNPIGRHHERVALTVCDKTKMPVWFSPCYRHQYGKDVVDPKHRLAMCRIVSDKYDDALHTVDWEINFKMDKPSYEVARWMKGLMKGVDFYFVIGTDNANDIAEGKWKESPILLAENRFIVVERGGFEPKCDWFREEPHIFVESDIQMESNFIRGAISGNNQKFAEKALDPDVWRYIQREGLYK